MPLASPAKHPYPWVLPMGMDGNNNDPSFESTRRYAGGVISVTVVPDVAVAFVPA